MRYYVFVKSSFSVLNIIVRNASPRGPMCFRCLINYLDLILLFFTLFYSLLDLRSSECDVVSLYVVCFSVNVSVCFVYFCIYSPGFVVIHVNNLFHSLNEF